MIPGSILIEVSLSGSNASVIGAVEVLKEYVTSECHIRYAGVTLTCDKDSLVISGVTQHLQVILDLHVQLYMYMWYTIDYNTVIL